MKLIYYTLIRFSLALTVVLTVWAVFFYVTMMDEINDEVDDSLEDYSEMIIQRALAGEELPHKDIGSNNQFFLQRVSADDASRREAVVYKDSMVYISGKEETEPARILTTLFKDPSGAYYELSVFTPTIEKEDLRDAVEMWVFLLYFSLLVCIILISIWVFRRNMKPLYVLLSWLDAHQMGKKSEPLHNETEITEFRKLNEAAVRHVHRSEELFEQQKQFIGNASHEIQTPLAICRNRLEMLMEDESLSENQLMELVKTHQTLEYITKLNKSLLLLTKIDNGQFADTQDLLLNDLLKRYLSDYEEVYDYLQISLSLEERGNFQVRMNESLAVALLTNLLKNAFVHNVEGGRIWIRISEDCILFQNTGDVQPLDGDHIFERFYQGHKKEGSTGLGLAIADSICRLQLFRLQYSFVEGRHSFEIRRS